MGSTAAGIMGRSPPRRGAQGDQRADDHAHGDVGSGLSTMPPCVEYSSWVTTFAANAGNLLQHAPLCEVVRSLVDHPFIESLLLIDAHAMAPLATARRPPRAEFIAFQRTLRSSQLTLTQAWLALTKDPNLYPSTASLIDTLWRGDLAMVLCEKDAATADAIERWRDALPNSRRQRVEVWRGDWRDRFSAGFQRTLSTWPCDLTVVSLDPYLFHLAGPTKDTGKMWPDDIDRVCAAVKPFEAVLVQVSTYSTNGDNRQSDVHASWKTRFAGNALRPAGTLVSPRHGMMTAFFARGSWPISRVLDAIKGCQRDIGISLSDDLVVIETEGAV
jgi:hypothetical protein